MEAEPPLSFSAARKWSLSLSLLLALVATLALLVMINYLAARHFARLPLSAAARTQLSPLTGRVLASLTNELKVTVFYDKEEPLYDSVRVLLQEYKYRNPKISLELVDQVRDTAAANLVKARYKLTAGADKNLVIFDCNGRTVFKHDNELSDVDLNPLISGQTNEVRRTHFKGEMIFTSAILSVSAFRPLKAYFLQGHGEHKPGSEEPLMGYAKFAGVLQENNVQFETLSLLGTGDLPADCNLLIIAGPHEPLLQDELEKIERYLKQIGRASCRERV